MYAHPKIGEPWRGYYLTAYGIAVKHGFEGTEAEWLESLIGPQGEGVEIRYNAGADTLEWKALSAAQWATLMSVAQLRGSLVEATLDRAEDAAAAAERAQKSIEGMTVSSVTLSSESAASVKKTTRGGAVNLEFGIPRGKQGATGPRGPQGVQGVQGERGISGVAVASDGQYAFNVNAEGHLILSYTGDEAPNFSINGDGHLILTV